MNAGQHPFSLVLDARASVASKAWFEQNLAQLNLDNFNLVFAAAGRRLGDSPVQLISSEREALLAARAVPPEGWRLCDVGRSLLLLTMQQSVAGTALPAWLEQQFRKGDNREREALLKTLAMLSGPERFVSLAVEACRSHVQSVFEAIACENPYPAQYFPDGAFNQMVLKACFTEVELKRIIDLPRRRTAELSRMANDYASERRAAGRAVPPDLELVTFRETQNSANES